MIRILVVDESATDRALLGEILRSDPEIQIVGEAKDGVEGVELTRKLRPQLVTMDINMPRLDGLAATKEIMITAPTAIIIVTGSTDAGEIEAAMNTLHTGAVAVMRKPPGPGAATFEEEARRFLETVRAMAQVKVVRHWRPTPPLTIPARPATRPGDKRGQVVAIAASTGGPAALHRLLQLLPAEFPAPILIVQHITPGFAPGLAAWLNSAGSFPVKLAEHGERLAPHTVYLAPDDRHLGVSGHRTCAETKFRSVTA